MLGGTKTVPLCVECHSKIHGRPLSSVELIKEGMRKACEEGRHPGTPRTIDYDKVLELYRAGHTRKEIAFELGVGYQAIKTIIYRSKKREC